VSGFISNTENFRPHITPVPDRLKGKTALITGAARGIGKAIALRFAQERASIAVVDRDFPAALETVREVESRGVQGVALHADVSKRDEVQAAAEAAKDRLNGIDIVVNNAGIIVFGSLMECRVEDWERMMEVDLTGAFHVTQIVGGMMMEQKRGGRMIHIGSTASLLPTAKQAAYCVAKAGLMMMSRLAALEMVEHGITSNLLCPQGAVTEINRDLLSDPAVMKALEDNIPAHRMSTVEEIAACAAFLASDEAAYITGTELVHDGGSVISALWWR
jgi:NAD(P)-dependent dehydrogenase (short-subunit alcohol dehydrogenase family)